MRIITGEYRGRKLESPIGNSVRPTTDKVKEAMFNILMNQTFEAVVVDLFAGSGNLGLEALSRGARKCYFCDSARSSVNLIKTNVAKCKAEDKSVILAGDYTKALHRIKDNVDIFLLDPPYKAGLYEKCLQEISDLQLLSEDGIIVCEHGKKDKMPEEIGDFVVTRFKTYGTMALTTYMYKGEDEDE